MTAPKWAEATAANDALILRTFDERPEWFHQKVESRLVDQDGCRVWLHASDTRYGLVQIPPRISGRRSKVVKTHRTAYLHAYGPIPFGMTLDHVCENTFCADPTHLVIATQAENVMRAADSGRMDRYPKDWLSRAESLVSAQWGVA